MSIDEAEAALRSIDGFQGSTESLVPVSGQANYASGMSIHTHLDSDRLVNAIEVFRPHRDDSVVLEDIDLFGAPAQVVIEQLGRFTEIEDEERGSSIVAPSLLIALWRPFVATDEADEQGYYFQSVLLARPGYYD
ncbi:hypothetical protein [Streptomyces sp. NPDC047079]|uniref:hypothetical protein n=1 Tax=Streptomyces sp. NPDC047079 TaxID=3154607 RepID=UPI0033FE5C3B